jgi:hypothetical protein
LNHPLTVREPSGAQAIVGEWISRCPSRPPKSVIGQMAKQVEALLAEGIDPDHVRRGIAQWMTKDLHPSVLPSIVNSIMNGRANGSRLTERNAANLELIERMAERDRQRIEGKK